MGTIKSGISGPFSGKVGPVVGCTWKGIPYMRALPRKRTSKPSEAEEANRLKFAVAQAWLKPLLTFVRQGFNGYSPTVEGFVAAKSYLMRNAMEGESPNYVINPAKMKLSHGDLPNAQNAAAVYKAETQQIIFTWDPEIPSAASDRDQVMLMAYFASESRAISMTMGVFRKVGTDELHISNELNGKEADIYIAFVAADRSRQSDSVYLGRIICE